MTLPFMFQLTFEWWNFILMLTAMICEAMVVYNQSDRHLQHHIFSNCAALNPQRVF